MKTTLALVLTLFASLACLPGHALADSHSEKKDAMKKAPEAKPAAPVMPKAPAEVAAMHKAMAGNWRCTGKGAFDMAKPTEMTDFKGSYKATLDLDKFWIKGEWTGTVAKSKMKGIMYMTFDPATKKWHRVMVDNMGMSGSESSTGLPEGAKEGKMTWEGESRMGGQTIKGRTTEEVAAKSVKMTSEMSMDGRKWMTVMEMTCIK